MRFHGLTIDEERQFDDLRLKLKRAREAAIGPAAAYDAALAEMREFVENAHFKAEEFLGERYRVSDVTVRTTDHKVAVQKYESAWYEPTNGNLLATNFVAVTQAHIDLIEDLPVKP
ncbi:hypothetical protein [Bradyrhizobium liaoningense]|uniref:hypothetical protein n=1 Tax=Bradyrhizobium liaoningense TaxID=43992 RepID=UPI001BA88959|nr:hypothetical protein [Bradyrhizobium liaoningense]MBR0823012.1 hypothetical protein [Bradyrhizobium liaoningense]